MAEYPRRSETPYRPAYLPGPPPIEHRYVCSDCGAEHWIVKDVAALIGGETYCPSCGGSHLTLKPEMRPVPVQAPAENAMLTLNDYQERAHGTAVYPRNMALVYTALGLANEAGEFQGVVKKVIRGDYPGADISKPVKTIPPEVQAWMRKELGDLLWYLAEAANVLGVSLSGIANDNLAKLADRADRGTLKGSGEER